MLGEVVCAKVNFVTENNRFVNWLSPPDSHVAFSSPTITTNPQNSSYTPTVVGTWKATIADPSDSSIIPVVFTVVQPQPLATYAADCVTPKSTFNLGNIVCAKVVGLNIAFGRSFSWVDPSGFGRQVTPITSSNQTDSYTLPATQTSVIGGFFVVDNRGVWKVNVVSSRGVVLSQPFNVQGATATTDLSLVKFLNGNSPDAGTNFSYIISLNNFGPNDATNVQLSDPQPLNATYVSGSATQLSGPPFSCTGSNPVVCTPTSANATLAVGATALFQLTYTAGSAGSTVTNIATVTSDTAELNPDDNTANSGRVTIGGGGGTPPTCTLDCPSDISTATNVTGGANVTFPSPEKFGDCGTVNTDHLSGSFFPIGTTTVTAQSTVGLGVCTFHVTVIDVPNPTISCPANKTVAAPSGATEVSVTTGSPTAVGSSVTLFGLRSDSQHTEDPPLDFPGLTDPYPIGTTLITWTATDQYGRSASCIQKIIVTSVDAPTITCPIDRSFAAPSGCQMTLTAAQIGTPITGGAAGPSGVPCPDDQHRSNPCALRSDHLALTDPFPAGQTAITWTVTNSIGSASCTEVITITTVGTGDTTPPTFTDPLPPDLNVTTTTCSPVLLDDELGVATATDNCTPAVNITRTGVPLTVCVLPNICPIDCSAQFGPGKTCNENFFFPIGTTNVTYTAKDAAGNQATFTQHVTVHELTPPTFTFVPPAVGPVFTGAGSTSCDAFVSDATLGMATVSDNCDTTVIRTGVPAGNIFPVGPTTITYRAKADLSVTATQIVTVVDNTPPAITCPADVLNVPTEPGICAAHVNPGTATAVDNCGGNPTIAGVRSDNLALTATYPRGTTTITWTATDAVGNHSSCDQTITVVDKEAPVIVLNGQTLSMWPPNHKYQTFPVTNFVTGVTDNCDSISVSSVVITKVTSDEIENGNGDGNTLNDIIIASNCKSVQLRSEREGNGNGRVYTIYFKVSDASGNVGTATAKVVVQHNPGETAVDSGVHYTVISNCP